MANLYGVANAPGLPYQVTSTDFATSTACTHDIYTVVATTPNFVAPSQGYFYAWVCCTFMVATGVALPSNIFFGASIGAGSVTQSFGMSAAGMIVSGQNNLTASFFTPVSQVAWQGAGSPIKIQCNPLTNNVTINQFSSGTILFLRAPDQ